MVGGLDRKVDCKICKRYYDVTQMLLDEKPFDLAWILLSTIARCSWEAMILSLLLPYAINRPTLSRVSQHPVRNYGYLISILTSHNDGN